MSDPEAPAAPAAPAAKAPTAAPATTPGIGLDIGTMNLVAARRTGGGVEHTRLRHRGGLMQRRTIGGMGTVFIVSFTRPSKGGIFVPVRLMFIVWHRSAIRLLISAWPRAFHLPASMGGCSITAPLVAHWFPAPFMHVDRPGNSYCWALLGRLIDRFMRVR